MSRLIPLIVLSVISSTIVSSFTLPSTINSSVHAIQERSPSKNEDSRNKILQSGYKNDKSIFKIEDTNLKDPILEFEEENPEIAVDQNLGTSQVINFATLVPKKLKTSEDQKSSDDQNLKTSEDRNLKTSEEQNLKTSEDQNPKTSEDKNLEDSSTSPSTGRQTVAANIATIITNVFGAIVERIRWNRISPLQIATLAALFFRRGGSEMPLGRFFGIAKKLKFVIPLLIAKFVIIIVKLGFLVMLSLKSVGIGMVLLLINVAKIFGKIGFLKALYFGSQKWDRISPPVRYHVEREPHFGWGGHPWDSHPGDWRSHTADWRSDFDDWKSHSGDWRSHSADWRSHSGDWGSHSGDWKSNSGDWKTNYAEWKSSSADLDSHPADWSSPSSPYSFYDRKDDKTVKTEKSVKNF